jgi:spore coat polysaccharide biosynthesis protein SpsF
MGSSRLPGKVLTEIAGEPLLRYVLERLERCRSLDVVVVATSTDDGDDAVATFCERIGVAVYRGPLDDVATRFRETVAANGLDAFARVNGDSPLLDPALLERGIALLVGENCDVATNVFPRSFPPGQSVEVVLASAFARACDAITDASDREHVTPYLYRHAGEFRIRNFSAERDYGSLRLVVDTGEDLERMRKIVSRMERPHWEYGLDDIVELAE